MKETLQLQSDKLVAELKSTTETNMAILAMLNDTVSQQHNDQSERMTRAIAAFAELYSSSFITLMSWASCRTEADKAEADEAIEEILNGAAYKCQGTLLDTTEAGHLADITTDLLESKRIAAAEFVAKLSTSLSL